VFRRRLFDTGQKPADSGRIAIQGHDEQVDVFRHKHEGNQSEAFIMTRIVNGPCQNPPPEIIGEERLSPAAENVSSCRCPSPSTCLIRFRCGPLLISRSTSSNTGKASATHPLGLQRNATRQVCRHGALLTRDFVCPPRNGQRRSAHLPCACHICVRRPRRRRCFQTPLGQFQVLQTASK
jgi:hypothetical protein